MFCWVFGRLLKLLYKLDSNHQILLLAWILQRAMSGQVHNKANFTRTICKRVSDFGAWIVVIVAYPLMPWSVLYGTYQWSVNVLFWNFLCVHGLLDVFWVSVLLNKYIWFLRKAFIIQAKRNTPLMCFCSGKSSFHGRSLHHIGDTPNPYEHAISIIGHTLSRFDDDNLIPCYGFGDGKLITYFQV